MKILYLGIVVGAGIIAAIIAVILMSYAVPSKTMYTGCRKYGDNQFDWNRWAYITKEYR